MYWHWIDMTALVWTCPWHTQLTMSSRMGSRHLEQSSMLSVKAGVSYWDDIGHRMDKEQTWTILHPELPLTLRTMCAVVEARFIDFRHKWCL